MLLDVCLGTRTSWKILFVLSEAPGKGVSRTEIRQLTRLGNKVITKFTALLVMFEIISSHKVGRTIYYKLNMSNQTTQRIVELILQEKKQLNNLNFEAANILREFVYELTNVSTDNIVNVILFGSHAKGTFTNTSDIDVAIIFRHKNPDHELLITDIISRLSKRFKKEIQPHHYTAQEFEKLRKTNKLVQEILKDGIYLV